MKRQSAVVAAGIALALAMVADRAMGFDISQLKPGTTYNWVTSTGNTTETYLGPVDGVYAFQFTRDDSQGQPLQMFWWADQGNQLTAVSGSGTTQWYTPNDCSLTVGECYYQQVDSNGKRTNMIRVTEVSGNTATYRLFRQGFLRRVLVQRGTFTVDNLGFVLSETDVDANGRTSFVRRLH